MKRLNRKGIVFVAALLAAVCIAQTGDMAAARERRKARKDQVVALIKANEAEEGASGYLVLKAGVNGEKAALVKAENEDRKIGYEAIAKANGKTVDEVAKQAASINQARAAKK